MMKYRFIVPTLVITLASFSTMADEPVDEVFVTATRTPTPVAKTLAPVTVITEGDIQRLQPVDLVDLLSRVPGVDISQSGSAGSTASLYLRGTNSDHTLFLIDGQRINSASLGNTNFQFIDPNQIERIEIVRGARSSIYGSDAIGGVIQIFTKKGNDEHQLNVSTEVGSNSLQRTSVATRGSKDNFRYALSTSYLDTDGIDSKVDNTGTNRDSDGYRNKSISTNLGYEFTNGIDVGLSFLQTDTRNFYDGSSTKDLYSDHWIQNLVFNLDIPVTDWWQSKVSLGRSVDDSDNIDGITGINESNFRTTRENASWQNDFSISDDQLLTLGYDFYDDDLDSSQTYEDSDKNPVSDRDNKAVFAQYQGAFSVFDVVVGIREDDNESFGTHTTGNISVGLQLDDDHRMTLSWAEGFKAPTFNDLYWPFFEGDWGFTSYGNPDLIPEESENYEVGLSGDYDSWRWELSAYQNRIDNLIQWAPVDVFFLEWTPSNVSTAKIKGGELVVAGQLAGWDISTAFSYTNPRDDSTDKVLLNRSKKSVLLDIDRRFSRWDVGLSMNARGKRYINTSNTDSLGGYTLVNFRVGYNLTDKLKAQLKVDNVFDKHYRTNASSSTRYNQDGTNWLFKLSYSI
jgi:vitamin B12 transporter